jgi:hypothetical protein
VLAWTLPHDVASAVHHVGGPAIGGDSATRIDITVHVDRRVQWQATHTHRSQAGGDGPEKARLALQADREWLRWLVPPAPHTWTRRRSDRP